MTKVRRRGADALARTLARAAVRRVFTLSGNHVMSVFDATIDAGVALVHTRHEAAAVHMADAWARLTGEVGVAMVTGGPGHANAISALYTAAMAESPVVLLSGHAPLAQLGAGAFQEMRQAEIAAPLAKASWTCAGPHAVAADLARAMRIARAGRPGPVHLSLPADVLDADAGAVSDAREPDAFAPATASLADGDARALLARLRAARRPLVLVGPASMTPGAAPGVRAFEAATGVPVVGMESPRGAADPALGRFPACLSRADFVLLVGKRVDFTLRFGAALAADARVAQIDADAQEIERAHRALGGRLESGVLADTGPALAVLADLAATAAGGSGLDDWRAEVREAIAYRPPAWRDAAPTEAGRLHPVQALRPLQALLDERPDAVLVCDGGEFGQWAQACLSAPARVLNGVAGAIGAGLPFAVAARLARPDAPVLAVSGDGSMGFHIAEFDTAVRERTAFVLVVGNDARWNAEHQIQLREYGAERAHGCTLLPTRYDAVCAAFGGHGEMVEDPAEMLPAARRARASALPACLNVAIEGLPAPQYPV